MSEIILNDELIKLRGELSTLREKVSQLTKDKEALTANNEELHESIKQKDQFYQQANTAWRLLEQQVSQLTSKIEAKELKSLRDDECIERITKHGYEQELKVQELTRELAKCESNGGPERG